jgi:hypothetical protein
MKKVSLATRSDNTCKETVKGQGRGDSDKTIEAHTKNTIVRLYAENYGEGQCREVYKGLYVRRVMTAGQYTVTDETVKVLTAAFESVVRCLYLQIERKQNV